MKEVKKKQQKKEREKRKQDIHFLVLRKKMLDGYLKKRHEKLKKKEQKEKQGEKIENNIKKL